MLIVKRIQAREKEVTDVMGAAAEEISPADALNGFMDDFDALLGTYADEYEEMRLDEAVVAAISPIVRLVDFSPILADRLTHDRFDDSSLPGIRLPIQRSLWRS